MKKTVMVAALTVSAAACGGDGGSGAWSGTVRDSAGVPIVENPAEGIWGPDDAWQLEEVFRVGGLDAEADAQFALVVGVDVDQQDRVYVADQQSRQIQVFDPAGAHLMTLGQAGAGPGEFGQALAGVFVHGGIVRAPDLMNQRVNLFSTDGEFVGTVPVSLTDGVPLRWDEAEDGELVIQRRGMAVEGMAALDEGDPITTIPEEGEEARVLATLPKGQTIQVQGQAARLRLFESEPTWDVTPAGKLARGMNSEYRIEIWSPETLVRVITRPAEPVEVTEAEERRILDLTRELMLGQGAPPQAVDQVLGQMECADEYPLFGQLLLLSDGSLWVQRIRTSREVPEGVEWNPQDLGSNEWDVFDPEGRYLGLMILPLRFQVLREVDGVLWGVQRDEYDVQSVVGLRLLKG